MSTTSRRPPDLAVDTRVAAEYLGVAPRTLERWRQTGDGPRYVRYSHKAVRYIQSDLQSFRERLARQATCEEED